MTKNRKIASLNWYSEQLRYCWSITKRRQVAALQKAAASDKTKGGALAPPFSHQKTFLS